MSPPPGTRIPDPRFPGFRGLSRGSGVRENRLGTSFEQGVRLGEALVSGTAAAVSKHNGGAPLGTRLVELLDLQAEDLVVGLGPVSSGCCLALLEQVSLRYQMVIVGSPTKRRDRLASEPSVRLIDMSALAFARFPTQWDKILLDGTLAEEGDGADELLRLLLARLRPRGRMIALLSAWKRRRSAALGRSMAFASRVQDSGFEASVDAARCLSDPYDLVVGEAHRA